MESPLSQGVHEGPKYPPMSINSFPKKETMAIASDSPPAKNSLPTRQNTTGILETPFTYKPGKMISLSPVDHAFVRNAIGATYDDIERHSLTQPKSRLFASRGLPDGLYRDVIRARVVCQYQYYFCLILSTLSIFLQLVLGAAITALASASTIGNTVITILAAVNTVNAGVVALMHNCGLPDRYKNDGIEYERVEMYMKELIDAGIVRDGLTRENVIADCYELFRKAKESVLRNKPSAYTATALVTSANPPPGAAFSTHAF